MTAPVHHRTAPDRVALTFDDGPSEWTPRVLEELADANALATFFVIAGRDPALVRAIAAAGHEVGYHCREHIRHSLRAEGDVRREAAADVDRLRSLGIEPRAWRTPWGDLAAWTPALADDLGLDLWNWSDDTHDWDGRESGRMLAELDKGLEGGAVILMHDGIGPGATRFDVSATIELINPLVSLCRARGLEPAPLTDGTREGLRVA